MSAVLPVSVVVVTKNEAQQIVACLETLKDFDEILVVDSQSTDTTQEIARECGARVESFVWDGKYPKKRQWILDNVSLKHDWVFFVDADEIVTPDLVDEIHRLFEKGSPVCAGYFVTGRYLIDGRVLRFGMPNRKIALLNKTKMEFPVVNDIDIPGMGEIEGHYQPVLKNSSDKIGLLETYLIHDAFDDERAWTFRHEKYARWEAGMTLKNAWPTDPVPWREAVKKALRGSKFRPELIFFLGFVLKMGFLDGKMGKKLAVSKYRYYKLIRYFTK
ncbi:MAG TPA: glycosyltransferase family 2 protein [Alphaproteobacteria bacterium]|nr:glycosyltransferase family 2 protein [Alphaproteobacteria bacterium]HNS43900.1 glycosyltransferase family 2 protein [Alphaproteobacteria bacterium]